MFALVDGNNFYVSCERIFDSRLRAKPVVVLSNNDGCAIARSAEAKALGIRMGHPAHELRHLTRDAGLIMRSANFCLYGDISARVVAVLRDFAPRVEIYSVDESFLDVTNVATAEAWGRDVRARVSQWVGIPTCVGIGPTKTLAKLANKVAKGGAGVVQVDAASRVLDDFPIPDVWGIGSRLTPRLAEMGFHTAAQLRDAPLELLLARFGVTVARTVRELRGQSCQELVEVEPDRQQILVSRSFGERVTDHDAVGQAMATFAVRACEKLRRGGLTAAAVGVFASTDVFRPDLPQHHPQRTMPLPAATADTRLILAAVAHLRRGLLHRGMAYKKAGIWLMDLARPEARQGDLFHAPIAGDAGLMTTVDRINQRFGRGAVGFGASGWREQPQWRMRQANVSPCYTTRVEDLPVALC